MPEFNTDTGVIFYELLGPDDATAPGITLLHNFMSNGRSAWGQIGQALAERYRVLIPDLPGHGRSQGYPAAFDHVEMARQVAALMAAVGMADGHLAGCSSGGMIAQLLVQQRFVTPKTLTLVSTTYSTNPDTTGNQAEITPENFRAGRGWMEATARLHDPHHGDGYYQEVLLPAFRALTPETAIDLSLADLRTWQLPVCIIHGEQDEFFPPFIVQDMAEAIPQAELHLIPEQTHALLFRQPWLVRDRMIDFLDRHPID
jgi:3-oxoadipate enol-lactonase